MSSHPVLTQGVTQGDKGNLGHNLFDRNNAQIFLLTFGEYLIGNSFSSKTDFLSTKVCRWKMVDTERIHEGGSKLTKTKQLLGTDADSLSIWSRDLSELQDFSGHDAFEFMEDESGQGHTGGKRSCSRSI